jgi:hypothetical protein
MSAAKSTLQSLYKANLGILKQKLDLIQVMKEQFGTDVAKVQYAKKCDVVQASIGQHVRHSMDHMELAANMAIQCATSLSTTRGPKLEIHYDLRERGGSDEKDMDVAEDRIRRVELLLKNEAIRQQSEDETQHRPDEVYAFFMLSGDPMEFQLPSTIERELGFATHHAIHHMAMVKIIAQETLKLPPELLPVDFGKAPSTIVFDNSHHGDDSSQ